MNARSQFRPVAALALCLALLIAPDSRATVLLADVFFDIAPPQGDASFDVTLNLNGMMLPAQNQLVDLSPGDRLRVVIDAAATGGGDVFGNVQIGFTLTDTANQALVHSVVDVTVDSTGPDALADGGRIYDCLEIADCSQPMDPLAPEFGIAAVTSDTVFGNEVDINDDVMPTGRTGGVETLIAEDLFNLDGSMPGLGDPFLFVSAGADVLADPDSTATASLVWDITIVPVPAAVWLFGSALGLLGWIRRKPPAS